MNSSAFYILRTGLQRTITLNYHQYSTFIFFSCLQAYIRFSLWASDHTTDLIQHLLLELYVALFFGK